MNLQSLGWNNFFRDHFKQYKSHGMLPARVASEQKKSYILLSNKGELKATARGIIWHQKKTSLKTPVVGDWVTMKLLPEKNSAMITAILPRKSSFCRKSAGGRKRFSGGKLIKQVIAANIDFGIITIGLDRDFSLRRIERYLALVQGSGAKPLIVLNKTDLCKDFKKRKAEADKISAGTAIITMSALQKGQAMVLKDYIKRGKTAALLGSSGVGKSTIINQLLGYQRQKVEELSIGIGKGRHTTSQRELIILPNGGLVIDNPGMREVQLWADEDDLQDIFDDIEILAQKCRFRNCQHNAEPGCAVKDSLDKGLLDKKRLKSYIKMKSELKELAQKQKGN